MSKRLVVAGGFGLVLAAAMAAMQRAATYEMATPVKKPTPEPEPRVPRHMRSKKRKLLFRP